MLRQKQHPVGQLVFGVNTLHLWVENRVPYLVFCRGFYPKVPLWGFGDNSDFPAIRKSVALEAVGLSCEVYHTTQDLVAGLKFEKRIQDLAFTRNLVCFFDSEVFFFFFCNGFSSFCLFLSFLRFGSGNTILLQFCLKV